MKEFNLQEPEDLTNASATTGLLYGSCEKGRLPADAMKSLDEKTKEAVKTTNAIEYLTSRGWTCVAPGGIDIKELSDAARELVEAVEGYVCPKKGDKYVFRNEVLAKCNALKKMLNETE